MRLSCVCCRCYTCKIMTLNQKNQHGLEDEKHKPQAESVLFLQLYSSIAFPLKKQKESEESGGGVAVLWI